VTITETKKPHKVVTKHITNSSDDLLNLLGNIKDILQKDQAMQIIILRDCHSEPAKQEAEKIG